SGCTDGKNFDDLCPFFRPAPADASMLGCVGVLFTDSRTDVFVPRSAGMSGCTRYFLDFVPDGMCTGSFNGDGHLGLALASRTLGYVIIMSGDGHGGLLDPGDRIMIPGGKGGPLACGDVDGDGKDDIVVLDIDQHVVNILRSRP